MQVKLYDLLLQSLQRHSLCRFVSEQQSGAFNWELNESDPSRVCTVTGKARACVCVHKILRCLSRLTQCLF